MHRIGREDVAAAGGEYAQMGTGSVGGLQLFGLALAGLWLAGTARVALADDADAAPEFRSVKGAIQQLLRSKKPKDRIDGSRSSKNFRPSMPPNLALTVGTKDESTEVREAAYSDGRSDRR